MVQATKERQCVDSHLVGAVRRDPSPGHLAPGIDAAYASDDSQPKCIAKGQFSTGDVAVGFGTVTLEPLKIGQVGLATDGTSAVFRVFRIKFSESTCH